MITHRKIGGIHFIQTRRYGMSFYIRAVASVADSTAQSAIDAWHDEAVKWERIVFRLLYIPVMMLCGIYFAALCDFWP